MDSEKNIETQLEQLAQAIPADNSFVDGVMNRIKTSSDNVQQKTKTPFVRRLFMKTSVKFAAAAIILIGAFLSLTLFKGVTPAYAIEQTIAACHSVRAIHIRTMIPQKEEPILVWAEFFDDGSPKSIRLVLPDWVRDDGAKEAVWQDDVAQIWFKKYNGLLRVREQGLAGSILEMVRQQDPKTFMQSLLDEQKNGQRKIQIEQPADKAQPVLVTAVNLPDKSQKLLLYVDQATRLPLKSEMYMLKDSQYSLECTIELYDYNQPIDPGMFTFDDLPADVILVDQVENQVGLEQGQMTSNQVAVEVVSCFWQAVIDGNYDAAGQMIEGIPGQALKKMFEENFPAKVIKIISVVPVDWYPKQSNQGVIVPCTFELEPEMSAARSIVISCTLEIEKNGQLAEQTFDRISVGQVYNQPGRWTIFGGI